MGPSLFVSALQLVMVTVHRSLDSLEDSVAIRAHLDDFSVTGSPLGARATPAHSTALVPEINLEPKNSQVRIVVWPSA